MVGLIVGLTVGDNVGEMVGETVGEIVGVGDNVGDTVGETVGETVGDMVGVGDNVGEIVGDIVGDNVGETVGDTVGDKVGEIVGDMVGVGVGAAATCTESFTHVALISCAILSYNTLTLTLNTNPLLSHALPTTSKSIHDKFPLPLTPGAPATLFIIRTTPCTPSGMNPQLSTGIPVPFIEPSLTPVTCITLAL
jgi:hypothetical protein